MKKTLRPLQAVVQEKIKFWTPFWGNVFTANRQWHSGPIVGVRVITNIPTEEMMVTPTRWS